MFLLLLALMGWRNVEPLSFGIECTSECFWAVHQFIKRHDSNLRAQLQTSAIRARISNMEAMKRIGSQQMRHLSHWVYPVAILDTEQCSRVGAMFRVPFSTLRHVGWIEPSIQEVGASLFSRYDGYIDDFYRLSLGGGYRYLLSPHWMCGAYSFYDVRRHTGFDEHWSAWKQWRHTFSGGIELFTPMGSVTGNFYQHTALSPQMRETDNIYPQKGWDIKIATQWRQLTLAVAGYYSAVDVYHTSYDDSDDPLLHSTDLYGYVISLQYTRGWKTYGLKHSYDRENRARLSFTMRWELLKPFSIASQPDRQLLWTPIERYLGPSAFDASGRDSLRFEADLCNAYLRLEEKEQLAWAKRESMKAVRAFREKFTGDWGGNQPTLRSDEKEVLKPLSALPILSTETLRYKAPTVALGEALGKEGLDLSALYMVRSATQNLMWLQALSQAKELTIGAVRGDDSRQLNYNGLGFNSWFAPTKDQLTMINRFCKIEGQYFPSIQAQELLSLQDNFKSSCSLAQLNNHYLDRSSYYDWTMPSYARVGLGDRLLLLEEIARTGLAPYRAIIKSTPTVAPSLEMLQAINQKLSHAIHDNLILQRTALLLTDLTGAIRSALCHFIYLPLQNRTAVLQEDTILKNVTQITGLRTLPFELRKPILEYVLIRYLNDRIRSNEDSRSQLLWYDMQSLKGDTLPLEALIPRYADRLLAYLLEIKTYEALKHYLIKIPYNHYKILF
jgi:hypothetical protein